jgi:hypothetical protein
MTPPVWLDDQGQRRPTRPCPRCGREAPVFRLRIEHLRLVGWRLFTVASYTNCCGHGQEFIPVPDDDGWCQMISLLGEAAQAPRGRSCTPNGA